MAGVQRGGQGERQGRVQRLLEPSDDRGGRPEPRLHGTPYVFRISSSSKF